MRPTDPAADQPGVRILLAEDNDADVYLVRRALEKASVRYMLTVARNGEEALEMLRNSERNSTANKPELILLDLNLPRIDGVQVLSQICKMPAFKEVPIIVLTSSDAPRDRARVLGLGATLYFRKPTDLTSFMALGQIVHDATQEIRDRRV